MTYCADAEHRDQEEDHAGAEHRRERLLPGVFVGQHHGEGEEGVEPHAGRQRDRVIGVKPHHQRRHRGGDAGRDEHRALVHAGLAEDRRVDEHDVDHRQKRGQAGDEFGADIGAVAAAARNSDRASLRSRTALVAFVGSQPSQIPHYFPSRRIARGSWPRCGRGETCPPARRNSDFGSDFNVRSLCADKRAEAADGFRSGIAGAPAIRLHHHLPHHLPELHDRARRPISPRSACCGCAPARSAISG